MLDEVELSIYFISSFDIFTSSFCCPLSFSPLSDTSPLLIVSTLRLKYTIVTTNMTIKEKLIALTIIANINS